MNRRRIVALVAAIAVVLGAFAVLASGVLPYRVYVIHTGSMSPTIPSTSAVLVRVGEYHTGQVVSFQTPDGIVTHRLLAAHADGSITTRGDANATDDPWSLTTKSIVGEVVASPRLVGYWLVFLKNPLGLGTILMGALVLWQIWSLAESADGTPARRRAPTRRHAPATARHGAPRHAA